MSEKLTNRQAVTVGALLVSAVFCVLSEGFIGKTKYSFAMDFRNAAFQRVRQTNLSEIHFYNATIKDGVVVQQYGTERIDWITNLYQIGPVKLAWTNAIISDPMSIGTNSVRAGMRLYDALRQRELGMVLPLGHDQRFSDAATKFTAPSLSLERVETASGKTSLSGSQTETDTADQFPAVRLEASFPFVDWSSELR